MHTQQTKAFSLIELMVVIAIVAILAAVAVPSYKTYVVKARVVQNISLAFNMLNNAVATYQSTGSFPSSIQIAGTTVVAGSHWQVINANSHGLSGLNYYTSARSMALQLNFSNLTGIPGFVASSGNPGGAGFSSFCVAAYDSGSGVIKKACGQSPYVNQDIPFAYLPSNCTCASVDTFSGSGTVC